MTTSRRRLDLDNLRTAAVLLLFAYHAARIFDGVPYYIKSTHAIRVLDLFARFVEQWHMPLFFTIAGSATWFALAQRAPGTYLAERIQRLLLPLLVGILLLVPPMGYFAVLYRGAESSFGTYYPTFFQVDFSRLDGFTGTFTPAHLWFLLFLFIFAALSLPLFRHGQRAQRKAMMERAATALAVRPSLIWVGVLPIYLARMSGLPYPNPLFFWLFFAYGYLFLAEPQLEKAMHHNERGATVIGLITMGLYLLLKATAFPLDDYTDGHPLYQLFLSVNNMAWLLMMLGLGRRYLNHNFVGWRYLHRAAYPLYLLHQTILVGIAYVVLQWPLTNWLRFGSIVAFTLGLTLAIYELTVRRSKLLQFAFGMK